MIVVKLVQNIGVLIPERELTEQEKETITSTLFNGIEAIYYQGDEPTTETTEGIETIIE